MYKVVKSFVLGFACLRISNGKSKESDNLGIGELPEGIFTYQ